MTVFMPVATPVSVGRTASVISVAMAANAKPMPTPSTNIAMRICQERSWKAASDAAAAETRASPAARGHLEPIRRPISPAIGPANSSANELGRR